MKYEFQDHRDYDEERVKRNTNTRRPGEWAVYYLGDVFIPAILGGLVGFFLLAVLPTLLTDLINSHSSANETVTRLLDKLGRDIGKVADGDFGNHVKIWLSFLFGFALVMVVKLANTDRQR